MIRYTPISRLLCAGFFVFVGLLHFVNEETFLAIMPPSLPRPLFWVYLSGVFEIVGGLGLMVPKLRRIAGWGLLALLVAVYPANIHMAVNEVYLPGMDGEPWMLWARLPFQFVFAGWVLWAAEIWPKHPQKPNTAVFRQPS